MTPTVLIVGGTGRTGRRVLEQLLARGASVRAIVRSSARLPAEALRHPALEVIEADVLSLPVEELARHVSDCDAVVSCLGHTISLAGVFGPPHDLVTRSVEKLCRAAEASRSGRPVRFVLMSSVSVDHPGGLDPPRPGAERALLRLLLALVPPARDNQRATDYLHGAIGPAHPCVQWVVVRPDTLLEGEAGAYALDPALRVSLFRPASTRMASVAHFMCELLTQHAVWEAWRGRLPVIVDAPAGASALAER